MANPAAQCPFSKENNKSRKRFLLLLSGIIV
jgi:hypothetical protein